MFECGCGFPVSNRLQFPTINVSRAPCLHEAKKRHWCWVTFCINALSLQRRKLGRYWIHTNRTISPQHSHPPTLAFRWVVGLYEEMFVLLLCLQEDDINQNGFTFLLLSFLEKLQKLVLHPTHCRNPNPNYEQQIFSH